MLSLVGCNLPGRPSPTSTPTRVAITQTNVAQVITPTPTQAVTPTNTVGSPQKLIVWLPPQFDPSAGTPPAT